MTQIHDYDKFSHPACRKKMVFEISSRLQNKSINKSSVFDVLNFGNRDSRTLRVENPDYQIFVTCGVQESSAAVWRGLTTRLSLNARLPPQAAQPPA